MTAIKVVIYLKELCTVRYAQLKQITSGSYRRICNSKQTLSLVLIFFSGLIGY